MAEKTMYETIMDLPLFKGVGKDQISAFLEKTEIHFSKYSAGERIVNRGEEVRTLRFVISGRIRVSCRCLHERVEVSSIIGNNVVLGATRLFGLDTTYLYDIDAEDNVSVMEFSKEKYMNMLKSDSIYLLNFVNLLSMAVQQHERISRDMTCTGLLRLLADWVLMYTFKESGDIRIEWKDSGNGSLDDAAGPYMLPELDQLLEKGLIEWEDGLIRVPDRENLLVYAENRQSEQNSI